MLKNIFEEQVAENFAMESMLNLAQNCFFPTLMIVYFLHIIDKHAVRDGNPTNWALLAFL